MLTHLTQLLTSVGLTPLHQLPEGAVTSVVSKQGSVIKVTQGRLWVTFDNDVRDYFVASGEEVRWPADCHAVLEAWCEREAVTMYILHTPFGETWKKERRSGVHL